MVAIVIVGGMGSIPGVILGALFLIGLPELFREFSDYRLLFYGIALMAIMIVRPEGLLPSQDRPSRTALGGGTDRRARRGAPDGGRDRRSGDAGVGGRHGRAWVASDGPEVEDLYDGDLNRRDARRAGMTTLLEGRRRSPSGSAA